MEIPEIKYTQRRVREGNGEITAHSHNNWELVCYLDGGGELITEHSVFTYSGGNIALIPPGERHSERNISRSELIFTVFATTDELRDGMYTVDGEIMRLAELMSAASSVRTLEEQTAARLYLQIILLKLRGMETAAGLPVGESNPSLESAFRYISDYYNTVIDPRELAASVGYSYDRFRHIFKERFGITPKQMILYKRIDAAKQLLCADAKISGIARECGFGSASQFNVIFRKTQGITPGEYRARSRRPSNPSAES